MTYMADYKSINPKPSQTGWVRLRKYLVRFAIVLLVVGTALESYTMFKFRNLTPSGSFVEVDGLKLHYRILGETGPKVIAIHGASGNLLDWIAGPAPAMAERYQVLLFDRPGLGFSDRAGKNGSDLSVQATLMRTAAAKLGFEKAIIVGHSFGGSVALAWALDAPETVDALVLLSAPSQVWPAGPSLLNRLASNPATGPVLSRVVPAISGQRLISAAVESIFEPQAAPKDYANNINAQLTLRPATVQANATDVVKLKSYIRQMVPRYNTLKMPVELLHGTADTIVPLEVHSIPLSKQITNSNLTILDGTGHMPHHVNQTELMSALLRLSEKTED